MRITVIGAGNIGTLVAGELSHHNNEVTLFTRDKSKWSNTIEVFNADNNEKYVEKIHFITDNYKLAVENAEVIIIALPAFAIKNTINNITPFIKKNTIIGFYPGTGGIEFNCKDLLNKNCIIFGTQRVCSVARLNEYGKSVTTSGKRKEMYLSTIPSKYKNKISKMFGDLFKIKTMALPNYLNITLTPSNPILHTTRLYTLFKDYKKGNVYDEIPLFYQDWTLESSKMLMNCDDELHQILAEINKFDTSGVKRLLEHYESTDEITLTNKIKSIKSFQGLETPQIKINGGFIPNLESRYFTADFPYGLLIIKAFGLIVKQNTPNIDEVLYWYQDLIGKKYIDENGNLDIDSEDISLPQNNDINTIEDIYNFYN